MSLEFPKKQKQAPKSEQLKQPFADFEEKTTHQPIQGLDLTSPTGEVLAKYDPKKEVQNILDKVRENRDKELIEKQLEKITTLEGFKTFLNEKGFPSQEHENLENEFIRILVSKDEDKKTKELQKKRQDRNKSFGDKLTEAMPTFAKWTKKGAELVDNHLSGNGIGKKLADLAEIIKRKEVEIAEKSDEKRAKFGENWTKEAVKSDEKRAKFDEYWKKTFENEKQRSRDISAEFKAAVAMEKKLEKSEGRKFPIPPNLFYALLGGAGLAISTGFLLNTSSPKIIQIDAPPTLTSPDNTPKMQNPNPESLQSQKINIIKSSAQTSKDLLTEIESSNTLSKNLVEYYKQRINYYETQVEQYRGGLETDKPVDNVLAEAIDLKTFLKLRVSEINKNNNYTIPLSPAINQIPQIPTPNNQNFSPSVSTPPPEPKPIPER